MTWKRFEDIEAWQMARVLNLKIHELISHMIPRNNFAIRDQMYRSAGSIMDNIAEGFERGSNNEFKTFLAYAKGSCGELRSQLHRCFDFEYLSEETYFNLRQQTEFISGKIQRIIQHLNRSNLKGSRFTNLDP